MNTEHLIKMANQIGGFYEAMPDRKQATADVAGHLRRFWEPRMRKALLAHIDAHGVGELLPIVAEAIAANRASLAENTATA